MRRMFTFAVASEDMKVEATPEVKAIPSPTIATTAMPFTKLTELIVDLCEWRAGEEGKGNKRKTDWCVGKRSSTVQGST